MALCLENIIHNNNNINNNDNDIDDNGYKLDILNISMGCLSCRSDRILKMLEQLSKEMIIIVSVGNDGPNMNSINFPSYVDNVIAVGGYDERTSREWIASSRG